MKIVVVMMNEIGCWVDDDASEAMTARIGSTRGDAAIRIILKDAVFVKQIRGGYECMVPSPECDANVSWADRICYPELASATH